MRIGSVIFRMNLACCLGWSAAHAQDASVLCVNASAPSAGTGTCWSAPFQDLEGALAAAEADPKIRQIWVTAGSYKPSRQTDALDSRTATFRLVEGVEILGGFAGNETEAAARNQDAATNGTVLTGDRNGDDTGDEEDPSRGENSYHVVTSEAVDATAVLDGFTITAGNANGKSVEEGGGLINRNGSPTIKNCLFLRNKARHGGGVYNDGGSATFAGCSFVENGPPEFGYTSYGGAMEVRTGSVALTQCVFRRNSSDESGGALLNRANANLKACSFIQNGSRIGGAIDNWGSLTVSECDFFQNSADYGGGIENSGSALLTNCRLQGNGARVGGAIENESGALTLTNCVLLDNGADDDGGAIRTDDTTTLINCSLVKNFASTGGGLHVDGFSLTSVVVTVANSIFWENAATSGGQIHHKGNQLTLSLSHNDIEGGTGGITGGGTVQDVGGNIDRTPTFIDLDGPDDEFGTADDDLRLRVGSPMTDAGDNDAAPLDPTDLDGDGNTSERLPLDLSRNARFVDDLVIPDSGHGSAPIVDIGPYESEGRRSTVCVASTAASSGNGSCWGTPFKDLNDALQMARSAAGVAEIWVAKGVYTPHPTSRDGTFQLIDGVAILGGFTGNETESGQRNADARTNGTVLSGDLARNDDPDDNPFGPSKNENAYHVVTSSGVSESAVLDGFTITNGNATGHSFGEFQFDRGGGLLNNGGSPTLRNCSFERNYASAFGGGLFNEGGSPRLTNCRFIRNLSFSFSPETPRGGGVAELRGSSILTNCAFHGNFASRDGGAIWSSESSSLLVNCAMSGNSAIDGGGLFTEESSVSLTNCTLAENLATGAGGAIFVASGEMSVSNSIVWANQGPAEEQIRAFGTSVVSLRHSDTQGGIPRIGGGGTVLDAGGNIDTDPSLIDLRGADGVVGTADDDLRIWWKSNVVDAGDNAAVPPDVLDLDGDGNRDEPLGLDLLGQPRFVDDPNAPDTGSGTAPIVDMGAYELHDLERIVGLPLPAVPTFASAVILLALRRRRDRRPKPARAGSPEVPFSQPDDVGPEPGPRHRRKALRTHRRARRLFRVILIPLLALSWRTGFAGTTTETLWTMSTEQVGDSPKGIAVGDADNDLDNDIVVANLYSDTVSVLKRSAGGWSRQDISVASQPRHVAIADADNDGDQDIVSSTAAGQVSILRWNGSSWDRQDVEVSAYPLGVVVGDANNDGGQEIVVANASSSSVSVLNWNGKTWIRNDVETLSSPQDVAIGDADNDGHNEIVAVCSTTTTNDTTVLKWNGTSWERDDTGPSGLGGFGGVHVLIGDADNDGENEIVSNHLLEWNNDSWTSKEWIGSAGIGKAALRDLDNDGDEDYVSIGDNSSYAFVSWWEGLSWRGELVPYEADDSDASGVAAGDLDGDGDVDLALSYEDLGVVRIALWKGDTWSERRVEVAADPRDVVIGDVDDDGDLDALTGNDGSNNVTVLRWNGGGWQRKDLPAGSDPGRIALGDVDNDGDTDIITADRGSNTVTVQRRTGDTWTPSGLPVVQKPMALSVGDADNDGDADIVVLSGDEVGLHPPVSVLRWNGVGWARDDLEVGSSQDGAALGLTVGDVDNDGANELLVSRSSRGYVLSWMDDRWATEIQSVVLAGLMRISIADVNADGKKDLVGMPSEIAHSLFVLQWTGNQGGSWDRTTLFGDGQISDVAVGDADNDADADIVAPPNVFRWTGTQWIQKAFLGNGAGVTVGDADNDGDHDIVVVGDELAIWRWIPAVSHPPVPVSGHIPPLVFLLVLLALARAFRRTDRAPGRGVSISDRTSLRSSLRLATIVLALSSLAARNVHAQTPALTLNGWVPVDLPAEGRAVAVGNVDSDAATEIVTVYTDFDAGVGRATISERTGAAWSSIDLAVARGPFEVVVGDVDSDGDNDIVTACDLNTAFAPDSITFLYRSSAGWFRSDLTVEDEITALAIGDPDHDGRNQLVFGKYRAETVTIIGSPFTDVVVGGSPQAVVIADADNDGDQDIVTANYPGSLSILRWSGAGWSRQDFKLSSPPYALAVGDADNDGDNDIVFGPKLGMLRWDGADWVEAPLTPITYEFFKEFRVSIGDVDQDGDQDIAATTDSGRLVILRWNLDHWIMESLDVRFGFGRLWDLALGDVDSDGDGDIVIPSEALLWSGRSWLREDVVVGEGEPFYSSRMIAGDADNDGLTDLVISNTSVETETVTILRAQAGVWTQTPLTAALEPRGLSLGDADGDSDSDIIFPHREGFSVFRWMGGNWVRKDRTFQGLDQIIVSDADNDGDPDLVALKSYAQGVTLFRWSGETWDFEDLDVGEFVAAIQVADADDDGDRDIIALSAFDPYGVTVLRWNGGGWTREDVTLAKSVLSDAIMTVGDPDNDGDQDILVGFDDGLTVLLWTGSQWMRKDFALDARATSLLVTDADVDGDQDIVVTSFPSQGIILYLWAGSSWNRTDLSVGRPPADGRTERCVAGDTDGDRVADLVALGDTFSVFRRTGASWTQDLLGFGFLTSPTDAIVADIDHDGTNEIAFLDSQSHTVRILRSPLEEALPVPSTNWSSLLVGFLPLVALSAPRLRSRSRRARRQRPH